MTLITMILQVAAGCTSMRTIENPDPRAAAAVLAVGDTVQVITKNGGKLRFTIAAIEADALIGTRDERVSIDEIHIVSVKRFDDRKSAVTAYGILALGISVAAITYVLGK